MQVEKDPLVYHYSRIFPLMKKFCKAVLQLFWLYRMNASVGGLCMENEVKNVLARFSCSLALYPIQMFHLLIRWVPFGYVLHFGTLLFLMESWTMFELTSTLSAGCCYRDACLWHCIGNCNANATIWSKKFKTAWYMEMAIVWVCSVLWSFWCLYKLEVSFALQNVTVEEDCWWICIDFLVFLRYLSCIMEVATPTEDCLLLIHELFYPVISRQQEITLSRQEVWYW